MMTIVRTIAIPGLLMLLMPLAEAQRVYSNSRNAAAAHSPHGFNDQGGFASGGGSRWGTPGEPHRSDWTLSPPTHRAPSYSHRNSSPYSNGGGISGYGYGGQVYGGLYGTGIIQYGGPPFSGAYSLPPIVPYAYSQHPGYHRFHDYRAGYLPSGVITPPIVVPYGGIGISAIPMTSGSVSTVITPSLAQPAANPTAPVPLQPVPQKDGEPLSVPIPMDARPIQDEFPAAVPQVEEATGTVDRLRSLRYQTSGDQDFRNHDFEAAAALYRTSAQTAPERRAPWLRLTWAQIAEERYADAAVSLKTALQLPNDPTSAWVPGTQLYGNQFTTIAAAQNEKLWDWLQQRPNSTDRLLLVAAFQEFQGDSGTARELLVSAIAGGIHQPLVQALRESRAESRESRVDGPDSRAERQQ
ncbi:MAG: tetratricopeptide repeat protein [Planctomycetaceae bacterium]